jgi:hypothetical protein
LSLLVNGLGTLSGITEWKIINPHVTWLDENSAVVLYTRTGTGRSEDQSIAPTAMTSTVWVRRDGKWPVGESNPSREYEGGTISWLSRSLSRRGWPRISAQIVARAGPGSERVVPRA